MSFFFSQLVINLESAFVLFYFNSSFQQSEYQPECSRFELEVNCGLFLKNGNIKVDKYRGSFFLKILKQKSNVVIKFLVLSRSFHTKNGSKNPILCTKNRYISSRIASNSISNYPRADDIKFLERFACSIFLLQICHSDHLTIIWPLFFQCCDFHFKGLKSNPRNGLSIICFFSAISWYYLL